ncbi:Signal transducer and activator of transcription 2 [Spatholobus suberectus]|nr:Signal transducer and activator of transcription 2 [Spatholobus suberectus]
MSQIQAPFQLLELNVISAQDLAGVGRNMRTYAVSWVHPDRKLSTRVDTQGHTNPTWNDKFVFRVDEEFLCSDTSAIMVEIYALHWFKDIHVGTVRVLVGNLAPPPSRPFHNNRAPLGMRFVALQVRRPSGRPQGILNIGFTVLDSSMRSMPLYTHNASAVGYRHLMGEKDAYDTHNHLSPHVFAASKPDLRRTKSDSSSMLAAEAVARHHLAAANKGKANSAISGSEVCVRKKKKGKNKSKKKKSSSVVSSVNETSSILSDTVLPWKVKNGKASPDDIVHLELLPPHHHNDVVVDNDNGNHHAHSTLNTFSEIATDEPNNVTEANDQEEHVQYGVRASPKPQFRNSPAPQFKNSPAPQFMNSPKPQFKNSPAPQYMNSPAPKFKNSPVPQFVNSPKPQFMNSPKPQFKNSPAPQFMNSPKPQLRNSPAPQFMNSPKPQFKNSPMPQYMNSPKPQFKNSPVPQFRNSPALSKFNPAVGFGGSQRGTPMHPFGKVNGGFEYMTPRRSNLGNMGPVVMTESELGPSPSEVAAAIARKPVIDEGENSTVGGWSLVESVEGLQSKLERWRTDLPPVIDGAELSSYPTSSAKTSHHTRRHTDGGSGSGLFSCFSNICGIECSIVCGGDPKGKKNRRRRSSTPSVENTSLL